MELYHPADMPLMKEVYETILLKSQTGASFCCKPFRFLTYNGCYVVVETEWSSFINPWSHHLEFVIGYHRVLKGPSVPNVLAERLSENCEVFSEEVLKQSKSIQDEIQKLLTKPVARPSDVKQKITKHCQVLESLIKPIVQEAFRANSSKKDLTLELPQEADLMFSERDSVMLGEISPHHDYFDSKSSSETPPSYNQVKIY